VTLLAFRIEKMILDGLNAANQQIVDLMASACLKNRKTLKKSGEKRKRLREDEEVDRRVD